LVFFSNPRNHLDIFAIFAFELINSVPLTEILPSQTKEIEWVRLCQKQDRKGQYAVYQHYAGKMMVVCRRYLGQSPDAEDALQEGFMKVFTKIDQFTEGKSFEGWIRRIMVNESLMKLRKNGSVYLKDIDETWDVGQPADALMQLSTQEIEGLIADMPDGYRTIFNLYAIEGYSHPEISQMLQISEGTSKSQLSRARALLQTKMKNVVV
jgi:RNA polymerase sigma-70 factor (ECF subfamily)